VEKIISKGHTPAGMHRSICLKEIMEVLKIVPGEIGLDATLGYGGHSSEILKRLVPGGHLFAIDVDPFEIVRTTDRLRALGYGPDVLTIRKINFSEIDHIVNESGLLNFVLADLGVSSMQIDNPDRGFSLKVDGPLDLRLDPQNGKSAAAFLKSASKSKLEEIFFENADEPHAEQIAEAIINRFKKGEKLETTFELKAVISQALKFISVTDPIDLEKKTCQRCFQALRIEVNDEFGSLNKFLEKLPDCLAPGGRAAILTFHSGEDRRVKKAFQLFYREAIFNDIAHEPIRPSADEIYSNPRARSAKLRWAVKG